MPKNQWYLCGYNRLKSEIKVQQSYNIKCIYISFLSPQNVQNLSLSTIITDYLALFLSFHPTINCSVRFVTYVPEISWEYVKIVEPRYLLMFWDFH